MVEVKRKMGIGAGLRGLGRTGMSDLHTQALVVSPEGRVGQAKYDIGVADLATSPSI